MLYSSVFDIQLSLFPPQMMSVHPSYCVSTQILDRLIEITLNNGEYLRDGELTN